MPFVTAVTATYYLPCEILLTVVLKILFLQDAWPVTANWICFHQFIYFFPYYFFSSYFMHTKPLIQAHIDGWAVYFLWILHFPMVQSLIFLPLMKKMSSFYNNHKGLPSSSLDFSPQLTAATAASICSSTETRNGEERR